MRIGLVVSAVVIAGCYSPSVTPGAPCSTEGTCPTGLICVAGLCQLGAGEPDAPGDASVLDTLDAPVDAAIDAAPLVWSPPVKLVNLDEAGSEGDPSFTTDRLTIVFTRNSDIYVGTRPAVGSAFTAAVFAVTSADEQSPEISPDGNTLYWTADVITVGDGDVYMSTRTGTTWGAPVRVDELSSSSDETDLAISPDGLTAVIRRSGGFSRATRATTTSPWSTPAAITGVNFGSSPAAPSLTAAGDLYFHANGADRDVFVARKSATSYLAPVPVTELNTAGRDAAPFVSADERFLVFDRNSSLYESAR